MAIAGLVFGSLTPASATSATPAAATPSAASVLPAQASDPAPTLAATDVVELMIVDFNGADSVLRYSLDGGSAGQFVTDEGTLGAARAVELGPDGLVYVAGADTGRVVRYDPADGSMVDVVVDTDAELDNPRGLAFDGDGNLLVVAAGTDEVLSFDRETGERIAVVAAEGLDNPGDAVVLDDGLLLVASQNTDSIIGYGDDGDVAVEIPTGPGSGPVDLVAGPDGELYVAMADAGRIDRVLLPGTPGRAATEPVVEPFIEADLVTPTSVALGPDGALWVTDHWSGSVHRFDPESGDDLGFVLQPDDAADPAGEPAASPVPSMPLGPVDLAFRVIATVDKPDQPVDEPDQPVDEPVDPAPTEPVEASTDRRFNPTERTDRWLRALGRPDAGVDFAENDGQADADVDYALLTTVYGAVVVDGGVALVADGVSAADAVVMEVVGAADEPANRRLDESPITLDVGPGPGRGIGPARRSDRSRGVVPDRLQPADPSRADDDDAVEFDEVVPGIDAVYSANGDDVEYSFVVAPGSDPNNIALDFANTDGLTIRPNGDLLIEAAVGPDFVSTAPITYQIVDGVRTVVDSSYVIGDGGTVGFTVGAFDRSLPLIIDPTFVAVDSAAGSYTSGSTIDLPVPTTVATDDLMIAQIAYSATGGGIITPPAGWTLLDETGANGITQALYWRVATVSEPAAYSFTLSSGATDTAVGAITLYDGVDTASPIDISAAQTNASAATVTAPSITTTVANATLVAFYAVRDDGNGTAPGGMTERTDVNSANGGAPADETLALSADEQLGAAGSTGTRTATVDATAGSIGTLVALNPASVVAAATDLVMVTGNGGFTGNFDSAKRTLFESWGWTVTAIDDNSSAAAFTAAASANDVMYVSDTAMTTIAYEVQDLDIGIVNEKFSAWNGLLYYGTQPQDWTTNTTINIVDNSHYITSPFSTGSLSIYTSGDDINYWPDGTDPLPAGVTSLADSPTSTNHVALHIADTGASLYSANTAINRRVWTPTDYSDPAVWNSNYDTLLERSLDWAAGNDSAGGSVPVSPTVTVNSTGDSGDNNIGDDLCDTGGTNAEGDPECTLRAAIEEANASATVDTIRFIIPTSESGHSGGVWTIQPGSFLGFLTDPVTIDATTQPGFVSAPVVELDGTSAAGATAGLSLRTDNSEIRGLSVHSFADDGIEIDGQTGFGDNNVIAGNWIGVDAAGAARPNVDAGIVLAIGAAGNRIGGTGPLDRNVIASNGTAGVQLREATTVNNEVVGNFIGVLADGVTARPNGTYGVQIHVGADTNRIGGVLVAEANVIADNTSDGVHLAADAGTSNTILRNSIHGNGGLGIDLGADGVTANTGADSWLDHPTITAANAAGGTVTVDFDLDVPAGDYRIEAFTNPSGADPSGSGEGEVFGSGTTITHTGSGSESFQVTYSGSGGDVVALTATEDLGGGSYGSTSEFSATFTATGGPIGRWRLDEGSGTTAIDSSGNGNNGTLVNGPAYIAAVSSTGLSFAGDSAEGVEIADPVDDLLDPGSGEIAIEAWMRVSAAPANGISHPLITKMDYQDDPSIDGYELALYGNSGAGRLFFKIWDDAPSSQASGVWQAMDWTNDWTDGQWHHVVGQINGSTLELWVDGVMVASGGHTAGTIIADNPLRFGVDQFGTNDFDGDLDEITIYGSALNAAEIAAGAGASPGESVVLDDIQSGTATIAGGSSSTSVTIAAVDPTKAFLTFSVRGSNTSPENLSVSGRLSNSTTVAFDRVGTSGNVTIEWSVVEFASGVAVQRGTVTPSSANTNVTIASVDLTKSFPLVSMRAGGVIYEGEDWVRARFTSDTNLELATNATFGNVIDWQVVEYNDANVQSGSVAFGTGDSSRTATATAFDPAKSWLVYNYRTTDGTTLNIGQKLVRGRVTDATTLTFDRSSTGQTLDLQYFLVEFSDTTEVQSGSATFSSSETTRNSTITAVDPTRSIAVGGYAQTGGRSAYTTDDNPGTGWFTTDLTSSTNLRVQRDANLAAADLGWFVVEWPDPVPPQAIVDATADATSADTATATIVDVAANDTDANGDAITVIDVTDPANGTASTNGDGTVTYTSDPAYTGADTFDYWAIDAGSALSHYWGLAGNGDDGVGAADGTLTGTATVTGNFGQALDFDEVDDRVTVPDFAYGSEFTVSFDFKIDDNTGSLFQYIYSHGNINSTNSINVFLLEGSHGTDPNQLRTVIRDGDDTLDNTALQVDVASLVADGQWHTYTATVDAGGITVYLDGVEAASDPTRGTGAVNPTGSLYVGARDDLNADRYYGGSLDTLQVYDRSLSSSEVSDLASDVNVATVSMTVNSGTPPTFTVNSTGDGSDATAGDGQCDTGGTNSQGADECTLRAAIEETNALSGATVDFAIPTTESGYSASPLSYTLTPASPYPLITEPIVLDATTQTGYSGDPIIELDGTGATGASGGLVLRSNDSTIRGFSVHSFVDEGLEIDGSTGFGDGNTLQNNWVGLDAAGSVRGNTDVGILVTVDALDNLIGGTGATDGNVVAGSGSIGILVRTNSTDNTILGNSVYSNAGLGIDLDEDGVTPNDGGDPDTGSNDLLNFPAITSATESSGTIDLTFDLDVPVNPNGYRVEFFSNPSGADPSGHGEGEQFVSAVTVSPGTGLNHSLAGSDGDVITATATVIDPGATSGFGPTSEFSVAVTVGVQTAVPPTTVVFRDGNNGYTGTVDTWISGNVPDQDNSAATLLEIDNSPVQHGLIRFDDIIGPGAGQIPAGATIVSADLVFEASDPSAADASLSLYRVLRTWVETDTWNSLTSGISTDDVEARSTTDAVHTGGLDLTNTPITIGGLAAAVQAWVDGDANQGWLLTLDRTNGWDAQSSENADVAGRPELRVTYVVGPVTHTVNSTGDGTDTTPGDAVCDTGSTNSAGDPECTLRAAIEESNAFSTVDVVNFAMPATEAGHAGGVWTISPGSALPDLSDQVTIDGSTQAGWTTTPVVELNGTSAGASTDGLRITADDVTVRSLAINRFGADGIELVSGAANALIAGNHIGVDPSGTIDRGNGARGIDLGSGSGPTTVGGTTSADRNLVSGNASDGIIIWASDNNVIIGNYIGTDVTGNASRPNDADGIAMGSTSAGNTIGQPGSGNVLSGNGNDGFENDATGANNTVQANHIGLGADGTTLVANSRHGVVLYNGANNTMIGGNGAGEGNVISGNGQSGVIIDGNANPATTANVIAGNLIGTDATGSLDRGNGTYGIHFFAGAAGNTVGGSTAAHGNVISGNGSGEGGIYITGTTTSGNIVRNNHVGVNETGTAAIANNLHGVWVNEAPNTQILDNLISGNNVHGVYVYGVGATGTQILRNSIGTNGAESAIVPNGFDGIRLEGGSSGTTVGSPGNGNVIGGNADHGVNINSSDGNTIQANHIGTDSGGSVDLGNTDAGVYSDAFGSSNNLIGGDGAGEGNTIAFNGVGVQLDSGDDNTMLGNSLYSNTGLGIDLGGAGLTVNDAGDGDAGSNDLLNFPVLTAPTAGETALDVDLDVPAGDYRIEVFTNPTAGANPSGYGEGETLVHAETITHTGSGVESFTLGGLPAWSAGDVASSTATEDLGGGSYGSTSEFSAVATATAASVATVNSTGDATDATPGDDVCDTGG